MIVKDGYVTVNKSSFNIEVSRKEGKSAWLKTQHEAKTPIGILEQVIPVIFPEKEKEAEAPVKKGK